MSFKIDNASTPIPNIFIDKYMLSAPYTYSIIYIYSYRNCFAGNGNISNTQIANKLDILESDVIKAWKFWSDKGIVSISDDGTITFLSILDKSDKTESEKTTIISEKRPSYSMQELSIYSQKNGNIRNLFQYAQEQMGKTISSNDMSIIFSLYDWLRLPLDVIEILIAYCCENGKGSARYIELVGIDWSNKGIDTKEKALDTIYISNKVYNPILRKIGQGFRVPTAIEKKFIDKWYKEYNFDLDLIFEACNRSANMIGEVNLKYVNGIIEDWHQKNVTNLEDIAKLDEEHKKKKTQTQFESTNTQQKKRKSKFVNYTERKIDPKRLEEIERIRLEKKLKEIDKKLEEKQNAEQN